MDSFNFVNARAKTLIWSLIFFLCSTIGWAQPANDDPCNATDLIVGSSCTLNSHTTLNATNSPGVPAPGCGDYQGSDVWFTVVMPSNGLHTMIELQGSGSFDGGIAVYSGVDCNNLILVACDDNSGGGTNPVLGIDDGCNFENVGSTFWVRVWENGANDNGAFDICAYSTTAPIAGGPTACNGNYLAGDVCCDAVLLSADELDGYCGNTFGYDDFPNSIDEFCANIENNSWLAFIAAGTTAELEFTASACVNTWGIQVQIFETNDCTNFIPKSNCWNPGFESSGTLAITDLTVGEIYYIHVDGWGEDFCDYSIAVNHGVASISVTAQDTTICNGQSTQLQAIAIGSGPFTYSWSPTFGLNDPTSPSPIASPATSTTYTVTITGPSGPVSESIDLTVFPSAPGGTSIAGPDQVCENTMGLTYSISDPDVSIYNWTVSGGGTIVGANDLSAVVVDWGSTGGQVCVDIANECGAAPSTCINVTTLIQPDIVATDPPVACAPAGVDLTSIQVTNNAPAAGPISYHPDQASAEAGWPIINPPTVFATGTYWIRMATGSDCYDVTSVNVVIEDPDVSLITPQPVCTPATVNLSNVVVFDNGWGPGTRTYHSDSLDAAAAINPLADPVVSVGGTYWMRFETSNACFDVVPIEVTIEQTPDVSIPQQPVICPGECLDLATVLYVDANNANIVTVDYYDNANFAIIPVPSLALSNTVVCTPGTYYLRTETPLGCFDVTEIIVGVGATPQAQIDGVGPVCPGTAADISFDLNGVGPFDVVLNDGTNNINLTGISDGHIESIIVNNNTTFTLVSIADQTNCPGMVVGSPVTINVTTPPVAEITGDVSLCGSSGVPLNFNLIGTGPFDVTYTDGTNIFTLTGISDGHTEMITPTNDETFTITSVVDANGCMGTFSGDAVIEFYEILEIINLSENCTPAQNAYVVSFEIIGGETGTYVVGGGSGNLLGNVFTSDEIPSNTPYNFIISDNSTCPSVDLVGVHNCQCLTDPGTMSTNLLEFCVNETVDGTELHNNDAQLEANDLLQFALHDNASNSLGTIFDIKSTPVFVMMPGMNPGTTYYISPIVGPDNGSGSIDMGHLCFGVGVGTPIVFYGLPQAVLSGGTAICSGENVTLTFNFNTGVPPFDVTYTDGVNSFDLQDINDGHTLTVNPTSNTTYSIVSVRDNTTATCEGFGSGIATVDIHEVPIVNNVTHTCNSTNTEYQVSFEISGGDAATYAVTGGSGTLDPITNIFTSDWMPNGSPYTFAVDDVNTCGPTMELGNHVCECSTETVTMSTETLQLCEDEMALATYTGTEVLDGDDVFGFVLHDLPGTVIGTVLATNSVPEFTFMPGLTYGTTYYISAVAGNDDGSGFPVLDATLDPCLAIAPGQAIVFTELPTASIQGTASICEGTSTDLTFLLTGNGPFDVVYTDGVNQLSLTNILDGHLETVTPASDVSYSLISVNLSNTPNCNGTIDPATVDITIIDIPEVQNVMVNCNVAGTDYRVTFDIIGGDPNNYFVDGDPGTLSGNTFTSNWRQSGSNFNFEISDGTICQPVIVSDIGLCNCTPDILPDIQVEQNINCPGDANGMLSVTNVNGLAPFNFEWSTGGVDATQSGLTQGMYHVTMTDGNGCISVDSIFLSDPDSINADLFPEPVTCHGENDGTLTVANITGGAGNYTYEVSPQSSYIENEFFKLKAGTYTVTISDELGCTTVEEAIIVEPDPIVVDLGETKTIIYGDSVRLEATFNQAVDSISWSPSVLVPCENCRKPFVQPFQSTTFALTAMNEFGCVGVGEVNVNVLPQRPVYIPNAFSPNEDDNNDEFMIYTGPGVVEIQTFKVFSRWGEPLYERNNIDPYLEDFGWNGTSNGRRLSTGVYIYFAEIQFADGSIEIFSGDVTLLR